MADTSGQTEPSVEKQLELHWSEGFGAVCLL